MTTTPSTPAPKLDNLGVTLNSFPSSVDYTVGMPSDLGVMLNDRLGDCTCAAFFHAIQVWTFNCGNMVTYSDNDVKLLYEKADGYVDGDSSTDQGGNENHVLDYLLSQGATTSDGKVQKIAAFVQLNEQNHDHIKSAVYDCGVVYLGFSVPSYILPPDGDAPPVWDINPSWDKQYEGGHAVIIAGYDDNGVKVISWGKYYTMTWNFWDAFVDQAFAMTSPDWINAKGVNPLGLSLDQLDSLMQTFKN